MHKTLREINSEKILLKYKSLYKDVQNGMTMKEVKEKYKYANVASARTIYSIIVKRIKFL